MKSYLSMIKFSHTIFAMPFAMVGLVWGFQQVAFNSSHIAIIFKVILCMIFARSAAMGFNRYIDRDIDAQNPRTQIREIPSGVISPQNALLFVILNCVAFVLTTYFINPLCFALSPVALAVVLVYSYTKRLTALCHLVLGLGLSLAPIGAFFAVTGGTNGALPAVLLSGAVLFWTGGFDIIYALQDEEFDRQHQLNSIPAWLGKVRALHVSEILHVIAGILLLSFVYLVQGNSWMWVAAFIFISMLIYQHILVKPHDLSRVNLAFFTTNGIASVVFGTLVIIGFLWG